MILKYLTRWIWQDYLDSQNKKIYELLQENLKISGVILKLTEVVDSLQAELVLEKQPEFARPTAWRNAYPKYETVDGLEVPPNTFITPNDRKIKQWLARKKLVGLGIRETAEKLEAYIYDYLTYRPDSTIEDWQSASYVFQRKGDDCDGHAILFQTCMQVLGFGGKTILRTGGADFGKGLIGHGYNKVLISGEWVVFDATTPKKIRPEETKYDIQLSGLGWFFNYWGVYKSDYL